MATASHNIDGSASIDHGAPHCRPTPGAAGRRDASPPHTHTQKRKGGRKKKGGRPQMNGRHYALTSVAPPCGPQRRPRAASRRPPMRQRRRHTATSAAAEVTTGTSHWPIRFVVARRSFVFCFLVFVFLFFVFFSVRFDCRLDGPLHSKTYLIGSLSLIFFIELASFKHIILLIRIHSNKNTEQYC